MAMDAKNLPPKRLHPLQLAVLSLLFIVLAGWLLKIGQALIVPILIALISVYILVEAADKLRCVPYLGRSPEWLRRLVVLMGFIGVLVLFAWVVVVTGNR